MRVAMVTETWEPSVNGVVTRLVATPLVATLPDLRAAGHDVLLVAPGAA